MPSCCTICCGLLAALAAAMTALVFAGLSGRYEVGAGLAETWLAVSGDDSLIGAYPSTLRAADRYETFQRTDVPSQVGKVAVVTGGHTALGFAVAMQLARKGAQVVITCPILKECAEPEAQINRQVVAGHAHSMALNPTILESVVLFANDFSAKFERLDTLVLQATYTRNSRGDGLTVDKFNRVFQINYLTTFATFHQLEPLLLNAAAEGGFPRVVVVSSVATALGNRPTRRVEDLRRPSKSGIDSSRIASEALALNVGLAKAITARFAGRGVANVCLVGLPHNGPSRPMALAKRYLPKLVGKPVAGYLVKLAKSMTEWSTIDGATSPLALGTVFETGGDLFRPVLYNATVPGNAHPTEFARLGWHLASDAVSGRLEELATGGAAKRAPLDEVAGPGPGGASAAAGDAKPPSRVDAPPDAGGECAASGAEVTAECAAPPEPPTAARAGAGAGHVDE